MRGTVTRGRSTTLNHEDKKMRYTRKQILQLADKLHDLIKDDPEKIMALLDAARKYLNISCKQNETGKNIRMADGSRKWMNQDDAREFLNRPVKDRR